jgi:hypothetical protein
LDVKTGNSQLLVNFYSSKVTYKLAIEAIPVLQIKESIVVPSEPLTFKRHFGLETERDHPDNNMVGPKEVDVEFDKI